MSDAIYYPPVFINKFLQEKLAVNGFGAVPMFPTYPSDFSIADGFSLDVLIGNSAQRFSFNGQAAVYDRMLKMRRTPFPHIKSEQLMIYFYALTQDAVVNLIKMTQHIQDLLDNEDESAQELNAWIASKVTRTDIVKGRKVNYVTFDGEEFLVPFFHKMKVYQLEETRDIVDFGTARTFAGNKIILDYDWHRS